VSENENRLKFFTSDDGEITQIKIIPRYFSDRALLRLATNQFVGTRETQLISIHETRRTIFSAGYIKEVNSLPIDKRVKHIVDTALNLRGAKEVHIQFFKKSDLIQ
jgi:hypothetical protein